MRKLYGIGRHKIIELGGYGLDGLTPRCYRRLGSATYETLNDVWFGRLPQLPLGSRDDVRWGVES